MQPTSRREDLLDHPRQAAVAGLLTAIGIPAAVALLQVLVPRFLTWLGSKFKWWGAAPFGHRGLDRLRAGRSCSYMDAAVHAALYPTAVALTSLLTSSTWRHLAFNADDAQTRRFLHRVAETVTDGYYPLAAKIHSATI